MHKLSQIQKELIEAMELNRWYDSCDVSLPRATGHTYQALIRKGWIEARQTSTDRWGYTPMVFNHEFRRIRPLEQEPGHTL